ncbi:MAG: hypothetical protein U0441_06040 [Polyangiaceae bacterium]
MNAPRIDVAIITMKEEEYVAALDAFSPDPEMLRNGRQRDYDVACVQTPKGACYVAITRCIHQGNAHAQSAASDVIDDLSPAFLLVVGIAGGVPTADFTLGDVILSSYIHDLTLEDTGTGTSRYNVLGGPLHSDAARIVERLQSILRSVPPPKVTRNRPLLEGRHTTDVADWNASVDDAFRYHREQGRALPMLRSERIASSDRLVKDPELISTWRSVIKSIACAEMETAGVYVVCQREGTPVLAIRGISDIIGWKRDDAWTLYACETAAQFAATIVSTGLLCWSSRQPIGEPTRSAQGASPPEAGSSVGTAARQVERARPMSKHEEPNSTPRHPIILNPFGEGDVAGELDALSDLYFVDTDFPRKALSDKINLIIGRRGAGKTALAHWLGLPRDATSRYYNIYVDVSSLALFAPTVTGIAERLRQEHHATEILASVWRVALLHALMVETLKDKHLTNRAGSLDMEHHLINKSIPRTQSASQVVLRVFQIIASALVPSISTTASLVTSVQSLENSPGFVAWRRALPEYLKASKQRAVIVIDTLEEYRIKDHAVQLFMASLSHAVSELSKASGAEGLEIKLFVPAEVAQSLEDTAILNIGKTFDRALFMHWRRKDLLRLMCWRLMYHLTTRFPMYCPPELKRYRELDWSDYSAIAKHVWDKFFPVGSRDRHTISSFAHISRFTQLRPRQFVLLCNAIAQRAHENRTFPKIQWQDLGNGIADVVDTLAKEVLSSFRSLYPDADRIVSTLATARDPQGLYVGLTYGNVDSLASQAKGLCTRETFWRLLLETGVLGVVTGDTELYTEARFEYIERQPLIPGMNDRFVVHPMFYGRLGIKPPREAKWVFPIGPEDLSVDY